MSPIPLLISKVEPLVDEFRRTPSRGDSTSSYLDLEKVRVRKSRTDLTPEETKTMVRKTMNLKHKMLIQLVYECGLSLSEAIMIRISDIDMKGGVIHVKNKTIPIPVKLIPQIEFYLRYYTHPNPYLFPSSHRNESPLPIKVAHQIVEAAASEAGVRSSPSLLHYF
ncbi:MAG: tyrosine-type recombinase/integrase [Nanoarchaeota archaeon]|nr:tyrosine-type recombinase/integrase [Nanoarchaeota archaeon]